MKKAWKEIARLVKANATHRKGFRLANVSEDFLLSSLLEEWRELAATGTKSETKEELADMMAIMIHVCLRLKITEVELEQEILKKLKKRFTIE